MITGATGFIGRNLAEYYSKFNEYEVYGTYFNSTPSPIPNVKMIHADLTKQADVDRVISGINILIQAAATTSGVKDIVSKPYYHVTDNAVMNALLFRAAYEHKLDTVLFFSCTVMYPSIDRALVEEDYDGSQPINPAYFGAAETKVYNEKMCKFFSTLSNTRYVVLRHSNVYGPYDKYDLERSHVFGATITKVLTNADGKVEVWGDGSQIRDFIHVDDLVEFVKISIENRQSNFELYNVGGDEHISVADLVRLIIKKSGKKIEITFNTSKPSINTKTWLNITKAKKTFNWAPRYSLESGIEQTVKWYRDYFIL